MKRYNLSIVTALLCFFLLGTEAVHSQDVDNIKYPKLNELKIPDITRVTLDNGMRLYIVRDRSLPTFNMSVRINCGDYLVDEDKIGLASICGEVLRTGGTKKFTGDKIDELLEGVGASVETSIGRFSGKASVNSLSEFSDMSLDILAQIIRYPQFDEDKIELAKVNERSGISRRNDDSQGIGFREFNRLIYGANSVYARQSEYATIESITRDDLIAFHEKYFRPENIQISIWGDINEKKLIKSIKKKFGDWEKGSLIVPALPKVEYTFTQQVHYINPTGDVTQSGIFIGHIGGLVTDDDYADRIVMNNVMGGGLGNRMFNAVRSREGLAYAASARYTSNISYPGVFRAYVGTKSETTVKAVREAIKVIQSMIDDPPTDEEMRKAKESYLNSFVFKFDTKSEIVNRLMTYEFYGIPEDFLFKLKSKIENVTADDVVAAAKNSLRLDALQILVVGKSQDFDMPLADLGYGSVNEIDVSIPSGEEVRELDITSENLAKGKELLGKAVSVHGGLANFKKIQTISSSGTYTIVQGPNEIDLTFEKKQVLPEQSSTEVEAFGRKMYQIHNAGVGWKTDQRTGEIVSKSEDDLLEDKKEIARDNILVFQSSDNPSYRALYDGSGNVQNVDVEFVAIIDEADELICRFGFNAASGELTCKYYHGKTPSGDGTIEELFSDFKEIQGVTLPMSIVRNFAGSKFSEINRTSYEINTDIDESVFEKPE